MFRTLPDTRWQAFFIHLSISLAILTVLLLILVFWWFPGLFIEFGGWHGITIVSGVDLVLGPLLTLVVYDKTKKSLKIDLAVIAAIQISCLSAGVWIVHQERPMYQALFWDTIEIVPYQDTLHKANTNQKPIDPEILNQATPRLVFVDLPESAEVFHAAQNANQFTEGISMAARLDLYRSLKKPNTLNDAKKRLAKFEFDKDKACHLLPVKSPHTQNKVACFSLNEGIIYIK